MLENAQEMDYSNLVMMKKKDSTQTGLYNKESGAWIKWVGKKEVNRLLINHVELIDLNN